MDQIVIVDQIVEYLSQYPSLQKFLIIIIGLVIIIGLLTSLKKNIYHRVKTENWYMTSKIIRFTGYLLVLFLIGIVYKDRLGGITVTLGFTSAGIAFALREVIVSVAGWLGILFVGFYNTGDRVQLGGIRGDVIDIGVLRTTLMELGEWVDGDLYNGRIVRIANSFVFSEPVFNYSADFPFLWDEITIPITYESNYEQAKAILEHSAKSVVEDYSNEAQIQWNQMIKKFRLENQSIHSMVSVQVNDNWVEYTLRYVVHYKKRRSTKNDLYIHILKGVAGSGGAVQLASTAIEIKQNTNINHR